MLCCFPRNWMNYSYFSHNIAMTICMPFVPKGLCASLFSGSSMDCGPMGCPMFGRHCMNICNFGSHKPHLLFQGKKCCRTQGHQVFQMQCREMLPLYRPLAYYVHTCCLENNFLQTACSCFLAWCDLLDYCAAIPLLPKPNQKHMQTAWKGLAGEPACGQRCIGHFTGRMRCKDGNAWQLAGA